MTENSKIFSQPEADELVPQRVPVSPWLVVAAAFTVAWLALGIVTLSGYSVLNMGRYIVHSVMLDPARYPYVALTEIPIDPAIVSAAAVIMVWPAFLRPRWSDRLLFAAAMILTSTVFLAGTDYALFKIFHRVYGSTIATTGVVAYGMLLAHARSRAHRPLAVLALLMMVWAGAYPLVFQVATPAAVIGGALLACAIFCYGMFVAELAGVKPFEDDRAAK